jgi:hypothetical protein
MSCGFTNGHLKMEEKTDNSADDRRKTDRFRRAGAFTKDGEITAIFINTGFILSIYLALIIVFCQ